VRGGRGRNGKIAPRKGRRRLGSVLFFVGILSVLGTTFVIGAMAGRLSLSPGAKDDERAAKPPPPAPPTLTFYRELTAPLAPSPPPPPRPPARAKEKTAKPDPAPADATRTGSMSLPSASPGVPDTATAPRRVDGGRYTVQVGSYNGRAQAEALRARLHAAGHDAYVAPGETGGGTRYRVRVGTYATMEEARQAAVRLGSEAQVATFVTTR
jgi:cell division protein FtsN